MSHSSLLDQRDVERTSSSDQSSLNRNPLRLLPFIVMPRLLHSISYRNSTKCVTKAQEPTVECTDLRIATD